LYTACLYCSKSLGSNEEIEQFPVGRRLAFDAARGRLWVVCPSCLRWCLTPIEERWEAIEACERAFRDTRVRASTPEISLVRLREGLELVRVGAPLLPEMAAWRYGREFSARRRRAMALGAGAVGVGAVGASLALSSGVAAAYVGLAAFGAPIIHMTGLIGFAAWSAIDSARAIRLMHDGKRLQVYRADLRDTNLVTTNTAEGWGLRLKHSYARIVLTGAEATRVAARLLARANGSGASGGVLSDATARLSAAPAFDTVLRQVAAHSESLTAARADAAREFRASFAGGPLTSGGKFDETLNPGGLPLLAPSMRLAFEMALHEDSERHALEGELAPLITAWREAEEIAGIADALLVPPAIDAQLDALRAKEPDHTQDTR